MPKNIEPTLKLISQYVSLEMKTSMRIFTALKKTNFKLFSENDELK